jgi:FG-GAP repeat
VTWEIDNNAFVANHNQPDVPMTWTVAATGDLDHDGDADIVWRNTTDGTVVA